jgi:omega-6 fatty acid desaturase (delta-12 desaturase)
MRRFRTHFFIRRADNPAAMPDTPPRHSSPDIEERKRLRAVLVRFQRPSTVRAIWQLASTILPYVGLWVAMYYVLQISLWVAAALAMLAGTLLVRVFIFFHDCGHGSFFKSHWANAITGFICGVLTFTPYYHWRWQHAIHHGSSGHLDKRGVGDIWTMTVQEYLDSTRWKRFSYRFQRNPFVLFVIAPLYIFLIRQRFAAADASPRERGSVWLMNLALLMVVVAMSWLFGFWNYLLLHLVAWMVAGASGIWLFYIQHQFEDAYWERAEQWDYTVAALQGSSYYRLPRVLQWLSGNIGFHHIHHLSPSIPNYNLERCHRADPVFQRVKPITLFGSLKSLRYRLWDEPSRKLVGFARVRHLLEERRRRRR